MKIIDCFIFYNELSLLQFRMNYLYDFVDHFVLVESSLTHSGNPKPFYFEQNKHLFHKYLDKIVHIKVYDDVPGSSFKLSFMKNIIPSSNNFWKCIDRGNFQRNCIDRGIQLLNLNDDDIIISGDADEFIDRNLLEKFRTNGLDKIYGLKQDLYYYNVTCKHKNTWDLARCIPYRNYKVFRNLASIRGSPNKPQNIENGGWHFSYFGTIDFIIDKIKQSADQTFNKDDFLDRERLRKKIENGEDLFERSYEEITHIPIDENPYLPDGYKFLIEMTK
jgi:beta-1,4-mannosyl-glycoprotein beta-1,4-N-acetylglucosaminyltransferase